MNEQTQLTGITESRRPPSPPAAGLPPTLASLAGGRNASLEGVTNRFRPRRGRWPEGPEGRTAMEGHMNADRDGALLPQTMSRGELR